MEFVNANQVSIQREQIVNLVQLDVKHVIQLQPAHAQQELFQTATAHAHVNREQY